MMHEREKSDLSVVARKPVNKLRPLSAESGWSEGSGPRANTGARSRASEPPPAHRLENSQAAVRHLSNKRNQLSKPSKVFYAKNAKTQ